MEKPAVKVDKLKYKTVSLPKLTRGIAADSTELIGNTPLVRLNRLTQGLKAEVVAKLESFNPLSSVKDRIGVAMIVSAEEAGLINKDTVIVEPTSGNTGIALAFVCAARGYRLILTMPDTMSLERRQLLSILGARAGAHAGRRRHAGGDQKGGAARGGERELVHAAAVQEPGQPGDPPPDHRRGDLAGHGRPGGHGGGRRGHRRHHYRHRGGHQGTKAGVQGHRRGAGRLAGALRGHAGPHKIQGIGAGFIPDVLRRDLIDEVVTVSNEDAGETARRLAREEGILAGISSGAAAWAALKVAGRPESAGKLIVVILPDTGERYLSTWLFEGNQ